MACGQREHITNGQDIWRRYSYRGTLWWGWQANFIFHSCHVFLTFDSQKTSGNGSWLCPWVQLLAEGGGRGSGVMQRSMSILDRCVKPAHTQGTRALSCPQQLGADWATVLKSNRKNGQSQFHSWIALLLFLIPEESSITWDKMSRQSLKKQSDPGQWGAEGTAKVEKWRVSWFTEHSKFWEWAGPVESIGERSHSDLEHHLQGSAMRCCR